MWDALTSGRRGAWKDRWGQGGHRGFMWGGGRGLRQRARLSCPCLRQLWSERGAQVGNPRETSRTVDRCTQSAEWLQSSRLSRAEMSLPD